jgi:hypothetical protein
MMHVTRRLTAVTGILGLLVASFPSAPTLAGEPEAGHRARKQLIDVDDIDLVNGEDLDDLTLLRAGSPRLDRLDGYLDWRPDRKLTHKQKSRIDKLIALMLDPQASHWWRGSAIVELGNWGHADAIPALVATLRDRNTMAPLRKDCLTALGRIADQRVVEPLIEAVGDAALGYVADGALRTITRANWGGWNTPDQPEQLRDPMPREPEKYKAWLRRRQERWRQWWKDNSDKTKLDRKAAFEPSGPM